MSQENCSQEKKFKASDDLYLFNAAHPSMPRQSKRRSSILKTIDANLGNFANEERRQSRRVSFANNLFLQELKPDGTTQLITEPFKNLSDDKFETVNSQNDSVELLPPIIRSEKRRKSSKSLRSYLSSHYNMQDDNDYTTVVNTSVNRTNAKRKYEEMQKKDLSTLFCDDEMELTKLDANRDNSKFTFNNSEFSSSNMNLTLCKNNEKIIYPVPKGFVASSTSSMNLTSLDISTFSKDQENGSIIDKENLIVAKSFKQLNDFNNQTQLYSSACMDLTSLNGDNKTSTKLLASSIGESKNTFVYTSPDDMELTDLGTNCEANNTQFTSEMSLTNLTSASTCFNNTTTNITSQKSEQYQNLTTISQNTSIVNFPVKNPKLNHLTLLSRTIDQMCTSEMDITTLSRTRQDQTNDDMELTDMELNRENEIGGNSFLDQMSIANLSSSHELNTTNLINYASSSSSQTQTSSSESKNSDDQDSSVQLPVKNPKLNNVSAFYDQENVSPKIVVSISLESTQAQKSEYEYNLNDQENKKLETISNNRSNNDASRTVQVNSVENISKNFVTHIYSSVNMDLTSLNGDEKTTNSTSIDDDEETQDQTEIVDSKSKNTDIYSSPMDMELTDMDLNRDTQFTNQLMHQTNLSLSTSTQNTSINTSTDAISQETDDNKTLSQASSVFEIPAKNPELNIIETNDKDQTVSSEMEITNLASVTNLNVVSSKDIDSSIQEKVNSFAEKQENSQLPQTSLVNIDDQAAITLSNAIESRSSNQNLEIIKSDSRYAHTQIFPSADMDLTSLNEDENVNLSFQTLPIEDKTQQTILGEEKTLESQFSNVNESPIEDQESNNLAPISQNDQSLKNEIELSNNTTKVISPKYVKLDTKKLQKFSSLPVSRRFNSNAWALKRDKLLHTTKNFTNQSLFANNSISNDDLDSTQNANIFVNKTVPIDLSLNVQNEKADQLGTCEIEKSCTDLANAEKSLSVNENFINVEEKMDSEECESVEEIESPIMDTKDAGKFDDQIELAGENNLSAAKEIDNINADDKTEQTEEKETPFENEIDSIKVSDEIESTEEKEPSFENENDSTQVGNEIKSVDEKESSAMKKNDSIKVDDKIELPEEKRPSFGNENHSIKVEDEVKSVDEKEFISVKEIINIEMNDEIEIREEKEPSFENENDSTQVGNEIKSVDEKESSAMKKNDSIKVDNEIELIEEKELTNDKESIEITEQSESIEARISDSNSSDLQATEIDQMPTEIDQMSTEIKDIKTQMFTSANMDLTSLNGEEKLSIMTDFVSVANTETTEFDKTEIVNQTNENVSFNCSPVDMELTDMELRRDSEMVNQSMTTDVYSKKIDETKEVGNRNSSIFEFPIKNSKLNNFTVNSQIINGTISSEMEISTNATRVISPKCIKLNTTKLAKSSSFSASKRFNSNAWALKKDKLYSIRNLKNQSLIQENNFTFNIEMTAPQVKKHNANKTAPIILPVNFQNKNSEQLQVSTLDKSIAKNDEIETAKKDLTLIAEVNATTNNEINVAKPIEKSEANIDTQMFSTINMDWTTPVAGSLSNATKNIKTQMFSSVDMDLTSLNGDEKTDYVNEFEPTNNIEMTEELNTESPLSSLMNQTKNREISEINSSTCKLQNRTVDILMNSIINNLDQKEKSMNETFSVKSRPANDSKLISEEKIETSEMNATNIKSIVDETTAIKFNANEIKFSEPQELVMEEQSNPVEEPKMNCDSIDEQIIETSESNKRNDSSNKTLDKYDEPMEVLMKEKDMSLFNMEMSRGHISIKETMSLIPEIMKAALKRNEEKNQQENLEASGKNSFCQDQLQSNRTFEIAPSKVIDNVEEKILIQDKSVANKTKDKLILPQDSPLSSNASSLEHLTAGLSDKKPKNSTFVVQHKELVDNEETASNNSSLEFRSTFVVQVKKTDDECANLQNTFVVQSKKDEKVITPEDNLMNVDLMLLTPVEKSNSIRRTSIFNNLSNIEKELNRDTMNDSIMAFQTQTAFSVDKTRSTNSTPSINRSESVDNLQLNNNEMVIENNFTNYKKSELEEQIEQAKKMMLEKSFFTDFVKDAMLYEDDKIKNYFSQHNRDMITFRTFNKHIKLSLDLESKCEDEYSNIRDMKLVFEFNKPLLKFWSDKFFLFDTERAQHRDFIQILELILTKQFEKMKVDLLTRYSTTEFLVNIEQEVELMLNKISEFVKDVKITTLKFINSEFKIKDDDSFDFLIQLFGIKNKLTIVLNIDFNTLLIRPRFSCWLEEKKLYPFDDIKKLIFDELNQTTDLKINNAIIKTNSVLRKLRNVYLEQTVRAAIANWNDD